MSDKRIDILIDLILKLIEISPLPAMLTTSQVCQIIGITERQFYNQVDELKEYGMVKRGKRWAMPVKGLYLYLNR